MKSKKSNAEQISILPERVSATRPLADLMRPEKWEDYEDLVQIDQVLVKQIRENNQCPCSLILWGPPGSGKTTLAKMIGKSVQGKFVELSAVLSGVKDVREIVERATIESLSTILFLDEIHRFNKSQQDAFLPHIEKGTILLIGATTENPSFYLTQALLSRCKVVSLKGHSLESTERIISRAAVTLSACIEQDAITLVAEMSSGDARKALNLLELLWRGCSIENHTVLSKSLVIELMKDGGVLHYDRNGDEHYSIISAFIKSLRGSDADAALYWGFRMIEAGEDPRFIIRRMMIFASEDIGNADPRALQVAVATADAYERIGLPEGRIPIAQCITYLATAPKSNRSYSAMNQVLSEIRQKGKVEVPVHLKNAPTGLMKQMGYGENYQYPHDYDNAHVSGVRYLPDGIRGGFYEPSDRGYEKNIKERLAFLKSGLPSAKIAK